MINFNNSDVRRQDRLLDLESATRIIKEGEFCILSMVETDVEDIKRGYGIPISYVWDGDDCIYFHCAPAGHKLCCIDSNPNISLCIVGQTKVISNKFTTAYESVIIRGKVIRNLPEQERMRALEMILDKYSPNDKEVGLKYAEKSFHRTEILKVEIKSVSAKAKRI